MTPAQPLATLALALLLALGLLLPCAALALVDTPPAYIWAPGQEQPTGPPAPGLCSSDCGGVDEPPLATPREVNPHAE